MADRASTPLPPKAKLPRARRNARSRRPGSVTALDVQSQNLVVAQSATRSGRTGVTRLESAPVDFDGPAGRTDPEAFGRAIGEALRDLRLKPVQVVLGIPRHLVVLRSLQVPVIDDVRELASVVHLQVAKDLPFRTDEAVLDFTVQRSTAPSGNGQGNGSSPGAAPETNEAPPKLEVLVAAVRRETVEFYEKAAEAAKLKLAGLGWLSQGNARTLEACEGLRYGETVALVSLQPDELGIDVVSEQSLVFSRGISLSNPAEAGDEADAPGAPGEPPVPPTTAAAGDPEVLVQMVVIELVRSLHSYAGMSGATAVSKVVVAGATGHEAAVVQALQQRLSIPCSILDVSQGLELPDANRHLALAAIGAMGLALGATDPEGLPFDFLSPKRPAVPRNTKRIKTLAAAAIGALLLVGLLAVHTHMKRQRARIISDLQMQVTAASKNVGTYKAMQRQAATIQQWQKEGRDWLEQYAHLSAVLPGAEDLYITSMSVSGQGAIHLAVQARSGEILAELDRRLREAGYDVKPLAINPGSEKNGYNFRTTVELIVPAKMKVDLAKRQPPARPADDASLDPKSRGPRKGGRS